MRQRASVADWPLAPQRQRVGRPASGVRQDRPGPASVNLLLVAWLVRPLLVRPSQITRWLLQPSIYLCRAVSCAGHVVSFSLALSHSSCCSGFDFELWLCCFSSVRLAAACAQPSFHAEPPSRSSAPVRPSGFRRRLPAATLLSIDLCAGRGRVSRAEKALLLSFPCRATRVAEYVCDRLPRVSRRRALAGEDACAPAASNGCRLAPPGATQWMGRTVKAAGWGPLPSAGLPPWFSSKLTINCTTGQALGSQAVARRPASVRHHRSHRRVKAENETINRALCSQLPKSTAG